jgi:hypothetical protein
MSSSPLQATASGAADLAGALTDPRKGALAAVLPPSLSRCVASPGPR